MKLYQLFTFALLCLSFNSVAQNDTWVAIQQKIDAKPFAGKNLKLTGAVKTEGDAGLALLIVRVDKKDKKMGFFDNMQDRPIQSAEWKTYTIEGKIDDDADSLYIGGICVNNGSFYFDDFVLQIETESGKWQNINLVNTDFEKNNLVNGLPQGWNYFMSQSQKFEFSFSSTSTYKGNYSLQVTGKEMEDNAGISSYLKLQKFVKANYNKMEYQVAMRDGIKIYTIAYIPKDASATNTYPIMLNRTPYSIGPYGKDKYSGQIGPSESMIMEKYIFVNQDVRGRYMSEGVWTNMTPHIVNKKSNKDVDESSDTYDGIDWMIKNIPFNNGRVGQSGISYPGFYSTAGSIDAHPALKAVSPQAPIADVFWDDFHHNGVFTQGYFWNLPIFGTRPVKPTEDDWYNLFEKPTPDGYDFYKRNGTLKSLGEKYYKDNFLWKELSEHPNYDEFWKSRGILQHLRNLKPAYLVVGGWFDAEDLFGVLSTYKEIEKNNPGIKNMITMGPFGHGDWASESGHHKHYQLYWGDSLSTFYQKEIEGKFFRHYLKESGDGKNGLPEAYMFNTGKKVYEQFSKWPPANINRKKLYLDSNEKISFDSPKISGFTEYISNPDKPVPYTMDIAGSFGITPRNYMSEDQRFASSRPDVLVYETEILADDITLGGEISVKLSVSTTGTDADWVVKLIDVYPGDEPNSNHTDKAVTLAGYQQMVRSEIMRSRFRNSFEKPEPMVPNKVTEVKFKLQDVLHTFKKGHRIMIQVQSTWFPAFDRNPQKFIPNIYKAEASDFIKATHRVYNSSYVEVDVIK
ncbi:MAG: CocE/NonD family hydrolase [Ferruginibacter sp.]|nr:CocE/NonD family hydrolase [Ferruginibacter sp.]